MKKIHIIHKLIMDVFISFAVFIAMLFIYVHITNQYKKSQDLEVYEMDYKNNEELQKVCELKQPVLFQIQSQVLQNVTIENLQSHETKYVKVKDTDDYYKKCDKTLKNISPSYIPFSSFHILMKTDPRGHYFIENNEEFMENSGLNAKISKEMDILLKPKYSLIIKRNYDVCMGSKNAELPLRFHTYHRHFIYVTSGKIHVKMTPYKNINLLEPDEDYDNYEFYSNLNVWKNTTENVQFLEFDVHEGFMFYIPPYWWYSIKYSNIENTILLNSTYHSLINCVAHSPQLIKYFIHQQNHQKQNMKKVNLKTENENKDDVIENMKVVSPLETETEIENKNEKVINEQKEYAQ